MRDVPRRIFAANMASHYQTRDSIQDIWGPRQPYKHQWPQREDIHFLSEPEKWVQSACVLCRSVTGHLIIHKDFPGELTVLQ